MRKRWYLVLLTALLAMGALGVQALPARAGILTSSNYTYLLKGKELNLPVDIITVQSSPMVPEDLLAAFGLKPAIEGDGVVLTRGPVTVRLQLGAETVWVNGKPRPLKAAPLKVSGRVFVPAEILPDLGASLTVDGKFVLLTDYLGAADAATDAAAPTGALRAYTLESFIRDGSTMANLTITSLTPDLIRDPALGIPWGTRLKLLTMLENRTLVMVSMKNQSVKATSLDPSKLMLVDPQGSQFDYTKVEVTVDGSVTAAVAPGALRVSVLVYPKVNAESFDLYYDGTGNVLGSLSAR